MATQFCSPILSVMQNMSRTEMAGLSQFGSILLIHLACI